MNPKWILVVMVAAFAIVIFKKAAHIGPPTPAAVEVTQDTSTARSKKDDVDNSAVWPPVTAGVTAAAVPTTNYYIVFDGSGSMSRRDCSGDDRKIEVAIDAVRRFVAQIPASDNVGLAVFDRRDLSERVPIGANNRDAIDQELGRIHAGESTPLKSAIHLGYEKLTAQASTQLGYGEYHLVVVTDGKPDPASEDPTREVKKILAHSPIVLHTIGFCIDSDHVLNQPGRTYYVSASSPDELKQGLQGVLAEAPTFDATKFAK